MKLNPYLYILVSIFQIQSLTAQHALLVLEKSFPDQNSEILQDYLVHPFDVVNFKGLYYVSDYSDNSLKIFSYEGNFVKEIGSKGQGPGELLQPAELAIDRKNEIIFCSESKNRRISSFSTDGEFLRSLRSSLRIGNLVANKGLIFASTYGYVKPYLFTLYDIKGQILRQFGEHFDKRFNKLDYGDILYSDVDLRINQDSLYVFFRRLPIIHVYNMEGNFIRSIDVKVDFVKKVYPHNINPKKVIDGNIRKIKDWMRGAFVDDHKFYCFALRKGQMLVLDHSGNLLETITFAKKETLDAYAFRNFIFKENDNFCFTDMREGQILIYKLVRD